MIKIIGIGYQIENILEILKKRNFQIKKTNLDFVYLKTYKNIERIDFFNSEKTFIISNFTEGIDREFTKKITKLASKKSGNVKNIIIMPHSKDGDNLKKAIVDLKELISINSNIKICIENNLKKDFESSNLIQFYNKIIYNAITIEDKIKCRSIIVEKKFNNIDYKIFINFWAKDYQAILIYPDCKMIYNTHLLYMIPAKFGLEEDKKNIPTNIHIINIRNIALNILSNLITMNMPTKV